jgi:putative NADH-flavin reductase
MRIAIFGATGSVGRECLEQALADGHEVTVLVRTPTKLPEALRNRVTVVQGDGLVPEDVDRALEGGTEAILFAIGIDAQSPEDLCTDVTRNILASMRRRGIQRLVWCGGGSTRVAEDQDSLGARFVELFARIFMGLRHRDKAHQLALLEESRDVDWLGVRPLQINKGPLTAEYRLGFDAYNAMSRISFADCAHAMLCMVTDDTWLHEAPILQY